MASVATSSRHSSLPRWQGDDTAFKVHEAWADVILFQGHAMTVFESLRASSKVLIADLYDPMQLEQSRSLGRADLERHVADATDVLNEQLERGNALISVVSLLPRSREQTDRMPAGSMKGWMNRVMSCCRLV